MSAFWHETTKNPPLLQGGAPRTNLGKDTTPNTPPSVPLIMWNYTVEEKSYDVRDEHMLHAQRSVFHTRQQWYLSNLIGIIHISHPSLWWAVTQIKPSIYWSPLVFHFILINTRPLYGLGTTADTTHAPTWTPEQFSHDFSVSKYFSIGKVHIWTGAQMNKFHLCPQILFFYYNTHTCCEITYTHIS